MQHAASTVGGRPSMALPRGGKLDGNSKVRRRAQWRRTSHSHATHSGAALTERAPPCRRVSMCGATSSGAAPYSAAPP
jgi:hypothetical protein